MIPAKPYMALALSFTLSRGMNICYWPDQRKALAYYELFGALLN